MTIHSSSVILLGQLFNAISDATMRGRIEAALALIRAQLNATAAVLSIENRQKSDPVFHVAEDAEVVESLHFAGLPPARIAHQMTIARETTHSLGTIHFDRDDKLRYALTLFRPMNRNAFDEEETVLANILVSHLGRGIELASRIGETEVECSLYSDVLDKLHVGIITLDPSGKVVRVSALASALLSAKEGLQIQSGRLRAISSSEDKSLQTAIRDALGQRQGEEKPSRGLSLTKRAGSRKIGVIVRPIAVDDGSAAPSVAIYVRDSDSALHVEGDLVRQIFDLTPAEAAVARRLVFGLSLEDAASSLDISRNTARAHLRSIFSKSGITRQTELVRLMLNSAVILGERPQQQVA